MNESLAPKIPSSGFTEVDPLVFKLHSTRPKNAKKIREAIKDNPGFIRADFAFDGEAEIYFTKEALPYRGGNGRSQEEKAAIPGTKRGTGKTGCGHPF